MSHQNICIDAFVAPAVRKPVLPRFGFARILSEFRAFREKQANLTRLQTLSDRQLRDIGINRFDLPPNVQDQLATNHGPHGLLALFPHAVIAGVGARTQKICD